MHALHDRMRSVSLGLLHVTVSRPVTSFALVEPSRQKPSQRDEV